MIHVARPFNLTSGHAGRRVAVAVALGIGLTATYVARYSMLTLHCSVAGREEARPLVGLLGMYCRHCNNYWTLRPRKLTTRLLLRLLLRLLPLLL